MPILSTSGLSKSYDGRPVLNNFSLEVNTGEWIGILGESGSGKSTLLKIISRLIDADEGAVFFRSEKLPLVASQLIAGHEKIRMIAQDYQLFPEHTAAENISYSMRFVDPEYSNQRLIRLLELSQLNTVRDQKAKRLSGGEKQRVAIATALAANPDILILDEPFAHLDAVNKQTMIQVIAGLRQKEKMACVFVTHDPAEALAWADQILIVKDGEVIQKGTPESIYMRPLTPYTALLTGKVNWLNKKKSALIRPEFLKITHKADRARHRLTIMEIWFAGPYYEYLGRDEKGLLLTFYRLRKDLRKGQQVMVAFEEKDIILLS